MIPPTWESECGSVKLWRGDCLEVMASWRGQVDAVVTDPPYGVGYQGSVTKHGTNGFSYASFDDTPESIASICVPAVRLAASIAKCAIVTPGIKNAHLYDPPDNQGSIFYPSGANRGPWGFICSQPLFYYGKDPFLARGKGSQPNGFSTTEAADRSIPHPCPKPIGQTTWMVQRVSFEGETIADPFMGSGTTGVAAVRLGRKFYGCEIDPNYFEVAKRRILEEMAKKRFTEGGDTSFTTKELRSMVNDSDLPDFSGGRE